MKALYTPGQSASNILGAPEMTQFASISIHPEVQDGAPVFSGTRIRIETFYDYLRIGVSVSEFLNEFPSITRDQALEVYDLAQNQYSVEQIAAMMAGPSSSVQPGEGRMVVAA